MKILVVGAGPAGLMFAHQMKKLKRNWDISIIEKNTQDEIFGWGVVLPGKAPHHPANPLSYLDHHEQLLPQYLEKFKLIHHNEFNMMSTGVTLCGVERRGLVKSLREHCLTLGITINYSSAAVKEGDLKSDEYDLVVISNGINHKTTYYNEQLAPKVEYGKNKYIWYGTPHLFDAMNLVFRVNSKGVFIAHSYKYSDNMSTFVVECSEETYQNADLDKLSDQASDVYIAKVFKPELDGEFLIGQAGLGWRNFMTLSHDKARHGNLVLLGDALQSGHFSIGHGTTMAVVGSQILVKALATTSDMISALNRYEEKVIPLMHLFRDHANASRLWFESAESRMHLSTTELAQSFNERRGQLPSLPSALAEALGDALDR